MRSWVVPADAVVDQDGHLVADTLLPMFGMDGFRLHASEEPLRGGVVRGTAFGARRPCQAVAVYERQPSGPLLVRRFGREVAVGEVAGSRCGLALVGTVPTTFGNMHRQTVFFHDPADHLLRDEGSEHGPDPAVPVPALRGGERLRHLRPEHGVFVNGQLGVVAVGGCSVRCRARMSSS